VANADEEVPARAPRRVPAKDRSACLEASEDDLAPRRVPNEEAENPNDLALDPKPDLPQLKIGPWLGERDAEAESPSDILVESEDEPPPRRDQSEEAENLPNDNLVENADDLLKRDPSEEAASRPRSNLAESDDDLPKRDQSEEAESLPRNSLVESAENPPKRDQSEEAESLQRSNLAESDEDRERARNKRDDVN
jgi:hypothetical protein